jgi:antagonist of KipI
MTHRLVSVVEGGLQTTVQDLGRRGLMRFGVAPGGALDRAALVLGNRLVGNPPEAAALEITLIGPRLRVSGSVVAALTGADLGATRDGWALPTWEPFRLGDGDEVSFRPAADGTTGARAYLCVGGGFAVDLVMGSRATDLFGGFGGWHGRPLRAGDALPVGEPSGEPDDLLRLGLVVPPPVYDREAPIRVVLGPQAERFTEEGIATFLAGPYTVTPRSDRTGLRLDGPTVAHARGADLISEGIGHGAIQIPGDGRPIVLLAARQTIGGYPKIATAIGADLDRLGQRRPGDPVRFEAVDVATARALTLAAREGLSRAVVATAPRAVPGPDVSSKPGRGRPGGEAGDTSADAWDPAAIARLTERLRDAGVTSFRLEIAGLGLRLELTREGAVGATGSHAAEAPAAGTDGSAAGDEVVTAPVLGVFYRRRTPDGPLLAEEGQEVEAGQRLGLLEVMKTYHEVTAPRAGRVAVFLVEDGAFVEYGEPIVRLAPSGRAERAS